MRRLMILTPAGVFLCWAAAAQLAPMDMTTTDGRTYRNAIVQRADPDGLVVSFQPEEPGFGVAKLKFRNLPDSVRSQYGYDADKASTFETQQAQANAQWRAQQPAGSWFETYRNVAELNRSLAGDWHASYTIFLDPNGKVSAQGFTGSFLPYSLWGYPGLSPCNLFGQSFGQPGPMSNNGQVRPAPPTEH